MYHVFGTAWDNNSFLIVEDTSEPKTGYAEYKCLLIDEALRKQSIGPQAPHKTWDSIDGRRLMWKNESRPCAEYLYFHYVQQCLALSELGKLSSVWEQTPGAIWASVPILSRGFVEDAAGFIGDGEIVKVLAGGLRGANFMRSQAEVRTHQIQMAFASRISGRRFGSDEDDVDEDAEMGDSDNE